MLQGYRKPSNGGIAQAQAAMTAVIATEALSKWQEIGQDLLNASPAMDNEEAVDAVMERLYDDLSMDQRVWLIAIGREAFYQRLSLV